MSANYYKIHKRKICLHEDNYLMSKVFVPTNYNKIYFRLTHQQKI